MCHQRAGGTKPHTPDVSTQRPHIDIKQHWGDDRPLWNPTVETPRGREKGHEKRWWPDSDQAPCLPNLVTQAERSQELPGKAEHWTSLFLFVNEHLYM